MRNPAERRLLRATRGARVHLAATVVLGAAGAALLVVQAVALAHIVAQVFLEGASLHDVRGAVLALGVAAVLRAVVAGATEVSGRLGAARSLAELRRRAVTRLLRDRPGALAGERTGELASSVVSGVDALEAWFARYLPQVVLAAIVPFGLLGFLVTRDVESTLILGATIPLVPVFMILVGKGAEVAAKRRFATLSLLGAHFLDVVQGLPTLRAFRRERAQVQTIADVGERLRKETMGTLRVAFLSALVLELLAMLGTAVAAGAIGVQLVDGALGLEAGLTVLILAPELYAPLRAMGTQYHASVDGLTAAERLFELIDAPPALARRDADRALPSPATEPVVLDGVWHRYDGSGADVLRDVSLTLEPGRITALAGPSGAGKSTIAMLALRLADPSSGFVTVGGVDLRDAAPEDWWTRIAWVPQRAWLGAGTVAEIVGPGDVWAALEVAGAAGFVAALPDGVDTVVGDGGRPLSAGERQRLAIARAAARDAELVVLDEPTAHLDADTAAGVAAALRRLCAGRTALVVSHDPILLAAADRTIHVEAGQVGPARQEVAA